MHLTQTGQGPLPLAPCSQNALHNPDRPPFPSPSDCLLPTTHPTAWTCTRTVYLTQVLKGVEEMASAIESTFVGLRCVQECIDVVSHFQDSALARLHVLSPTGASVVTADKQLSPLPSPCLQQPSEVKACGKGPGARCMSSGAKNLQLSVCCQSDDAETLLHGPITPAATSQAHEARPRNDKRLLEASVQCHGTDETLRGIDRSANTPHPTPCTTQHACIDQETSPTSKHEPVDPPHKYQALEQKCACKCGSLQ